MLFNPMLMKQATLAPIIGFSKQYKATDISSNAGTSRTVSGVDFGPAQADREIFVLYSFFSGVISSITIGGITATLSTEQTSTSENVKSGIAFATVPIGSSGNIVFTSTGSMIGFSCAIYRISGRVSVGAGETDTGVVRGSNVSTITVTGIDTSTNSTVFSTLSFNSITATGVSMTNLGMNIDISQVGTAYSAYYASSPQLASGSGQTIVNAWTTNVTAPFAGFWVFGA